VKYLLDTSTCIEFFNRRSERLIERMTATADSEVAVASIVKAELLTGALKRPDRDKAQRLEETLFRRYVSVPFDDAVGEHYASIRVHLEAIGRPIGGNDLMIAATARSRGLIVITKNRSEFDRVPDLLVEDWTAA
jgi:tRNA(fMet)-specific endonuclease VapC